MNTNKNNLKIYLFDMQGGKKLERSRDLFEQCLDGCPPKYAKGKSSGKIKVKVTYSRTLYRGHVLKIIHHWADFRQDYNLIGSLVPQGQRSLGSLSIVKT